MRFPHSKAELHWRMFGNGVPSVRGSLCIFQRPRDVNTPRWDTHYQLRKFTMLLVVILANIRGYFYNNPTVSNNKKASQLEEGQASNPNVPWHSIKKCIPCSCVVSFPLTTWAHLAYIRPIFQAYGSEYHHKIWPKIWYVYVPPF